MENTSQDTSPFYRLLLRWTGRDYLRFGLRASILLRWFSVIAWLAHSVTQTHFPQPSYLAHAIFAVALLAVNGYIHYRIETRRPVTWRWAFALSAMDIVMLTGGLTLSVGDGNNFFVLYYAGLAIFAAVCTSVTITFVGATVVGALYVALSSTAGQDGGLAVMENEALLPRVIGMYAVAGAVALVSRFEQIRSNLDRIRRREAVERERSLLQEMVDLSQTIHDTIAQSAFTIGLGLETAIELADAQNAENREELVAKLQAMLALSRSTVWELRHPIDAGAIFEGRELNRVLRSHCSMFSTITSIPAELVQSGAEPPLPAVTRRRLFSIAHNALTNVLRHAHAERITVLLSFELDHLRMSISDDGAGIPDDFSDNGHGFRNMRKEAERMGGALEIIPGESGRGTTVSCTIPYGEEQRIV